MNTNIEEEIVRGDKKTRIKLLLLFVGCLMFSVSNIYFINYFFSYDNSDSIQKLKMQLESLHTIRYIVAVPSLVGMWMIALLTARIGWRVLRSGTFPAPGMKVAFDTKRKKGAYAKVVGVLYLVFLPAVSLFWTVFLFVLWSLI
jgi:hypothetical protein